jgi:hypothetical protein
MKMDIKTTCQISYCDWRDIELKIEALAEGGTDNAKEVKNIKRLIDQQVQVAFNEGVEKAKLGLVT